MTTSDDLISSYNHTLSSTFSHPTLPFVHHTYNWSSCSNTISLSAPANALALSPDEKFLAIAAGSDVLIYNTEDDLDLAYTLKGHIGWVSQVEWYPGGEKKLVSGSSINGMYREEVVRFWDLNTEDPFVEANLDSEYATMVGTDYPEAESPTMVLQNGWLNKEASASEPQVFPI